MSIDERAARLARLADVPEALAQMVVAHADVRRVDLAALRSLQNPRRLYPVRQEIALKARAAGYSWWSIARALNRDHSTIIKSVQAAAGRVA